MDILNYLITNNISYERCDHPAVYTVEEAKRLVPDLHGTDVKNLFLKDKKKRRHFLVAVGFEKRVDLKNLSSVLGVPGLGFASSDRLMRYLGIEPGAVSLLAAVNDKDHAVEVIIDEPVWRAEYVHCHPLVNTSTLVISQTDLRHFFDCTGHTVKVVDVPGR
jgi:Ala-tRNA(Pro) deacylase